MAVAGALQAVDGVALKFTVDRWAAATGEARALAFEAAYAVRQVEVGLAAMLSLLFGVAIILLGAALAATPGTARALGALGLVAGLAMLAAGGLQASTGFSPQAMNASMAATAIVLFWILGVAALMWRAPSR